MRSIVTSVFAACLLSLNAAAQSGPLGVEGRWDGALGAGAARKRLVLEVTRASDGLYLAALTSIDDGNARIPIDRVTQSGDSVVLEVRAVGGRYAGLPSSDRTRLQGSWWQGGAAQPLNFARVGASPPVVNIPATASASAAPPAATAAPLNVDVAAPVTPIPVTGAGKTQLVYELNIANFSGLPMLITRIDALDGGKTLATFDGAALNSSLFQARMDVTDQRSLPAGARTTAYMWVTLDSGAAIPKSIRHRIAAGSASVETDAMPVSTDQPIVVGPPLRGTNWIAANGPNNGSIHRKALIPVNGHAFIAQRFAIDWIKMSDSRALLAGDPSNNKSYFGYGSEAIAVLDAVVVATKDGIPENVPGATRAVPITLETLGGNYVVLDLGDGHFATYLHLQPGSLRVKTGDHVKRGQVLGLVGNSGNSTLPHLHFHITNGNSPLGAEGLPYVIDSWEEMTAPAAWTARRNQLPLQDAFVRFP